MTASRLASGEKHRLVVEIAGPTTPTACPWRSNSVSWRALASRTWAMTLRPLGRIRGSGLPLDARRTEQQRSAHDRRDGERGELHDEHSSESGCR